MVPLLLAAWWEPLIPFAMVVGFVGLSLLQMAWKRSQRHDPSGDQPWPFPPQAPGDPADDPLASLRRYVRPSQPSSHGGSATPPPARPLSPWEQELERVLRGEPSVSPIPPPPPVMVPAAEHPRETPLPPLLVVREISESSDLESAPAPSRPLASLTTDTVDRAATLEDRVRAQMHQVDLRIGSATASKVPGRKVRLDPTVAALVRDLRKPATARQALIASVILGSPKALN